jgi:hypothetical protein
VAKVSTWNLRFFYNKNVPHEVESKTLTIRTIIIDLLLLDHSVNNTDLQVIQIKKKNFFFATHILL